MNSLEQGTFPTRKRQAKEMLGIKPETPPEAPKAPEMADRDVREKALRERSDRLIRQAMSLDAQFSLQLGKADWEKRLEDEKVFDTLSSGQEVEKTLLTEDQKGMSQVYRCELSGETAVHAYLKPSFSETRFNEDGDVSVWDEGSLTFRTMPLEEDQEIVKVVRDYCAGASRPEFDAARRFALSQKYGMPESDPRFEVEAFLPRLGIPPGELPEREYAMSRLCGALGWEEIPKTSIRKVQGGLDIASVQEAVPSQDPETPTSFLTSEELERLWETPPGEWENELDEEGNPQPFSSLVRLACLDYLAGSMDRHRGNLLYDTKAKKFFGIDNAFCFGMLNGVHVGESVHQPEPKAHPATQETSLYPTLKSIKENPNVRNLQSIPLEILLKHNLSLADHDRDQVVKAYEKLFPEGKPSPYVQDLLGFVFKDDTIAAVESQDLQKRFHTLLELGRPPEMKANQDYKPLVEEDLAALSIRRANQAKQMGGGA